MDQGQYSCCIFLDLSKAFDIVNHSILLQKLEKFYGFKGLAFNLIKSYLTNRIQYIKIGKSKSNLQKIECKIPQGSSLGPLLCTLKINDLPSVLTFSVTLFEDDTFLALYS